MIRNGRYKYNYYSEGARNEELFDMVEDPLEQNNLVSDPKYLEIKNKMKESLVRRLKETDDPFEI